MTILFTVLLIIAAVGAIAYWKKMSQRETAREEETTKQWNERSQDVYADNPVAQGDMDPMKLDLGDIIELDDGRSLPIRGIIDLDEEGWSWRSYYLGDDTDDNEIWLGVEADPDVVVTLWTSVMAGDVNPQVFNPAREREGTFRDVAYRLKESGKATWRAYGTTGLRQDGVAGTMVYRDFRSRATGLMLSSEQWGKGDPEVSVGRMLAFGTYTCYPGNNSRRST